MRRAYVALGSNLGDCKRQLDVALTALDRLPQTRVLAHSPFYRTAPWGVAEQPDFINAVAMLDTALEPHGLLDGLLAIERDAGRIRSQERWGPRTLDLDLLHVEGVQCADARLTLPHPRIGERAFVLLPLHDLAPSLSIPGQGTVAALLDGADASGCVRLP